MLMIERESAVSFNCLFRVGYTGDLAAVVRDTLAAATERIFSGKQLALKCTPSDGHRAHKVDLLREQGVVPADGLRTSSLSESHLSSLHHSTQ